MLIKKLIDKIYIWDDKILTLYNLENLFDYNETDSCENDVDTIIKAAANNCSAAAASGTPDRN
ncbi:MAG: hypothetical protein ACI4DP_03455 [Candidatus Ornithomonoglobus sp.]